jgi:hypothetical protein
VSFGDLEAKLQKGLAGVATAYFDPEVEFLWRPRKDFLEALQALQAEKGANALVDIPLLRQIVYEGRHFLAAFSDRQWQRDNEIAEYKTTDGIYDNVVSEGNRFTFVIPKNYPKDRALGKTPRPAPLPLLLAIHEEQDGKDAKMKAEKYPGGAVLRRHFPKNEHDDLYENWLIIAPVAARAKFLEDKAIRHLYLTGVLTNFWRRYFVDFDRILVDGAAPAAAMAAAFPHVFAGVVLRPGKEMAFEPEVVRNYATVPVYVVGDEEFGKELEKAGHTNVTVGSEKDVVPWMDAQRRKTPKSFKWRVLRPDHVAANWVVVTGPDYAAPEVSMEVESVDTQDDPNTIKIDARGIEHLRIFLNDEIVDLDRPVRLVVNGEVIEVGKIERDFSRLFERDPEVRRNMNFGWLYTAVIEDVRVPEPKAEEQPAEGPTETAPEEGPKGSPEDEARAAEWWGKGEAAEAEGITSRAKVYYRKIVELGPTSYLARATAKLETLP